MYHVLLPSFGVIMSRSGAKTAETKITNAFDDCVSSLASPPSVQLVLINVCGKYACRMQLVTFVMLDISVQHSMRPLPLHPASLGSWRRIIR